MPTCFLHFGERGTTAAVLCTRTDVFCNSRPVDEGSKGLKLLAKKQPGAYRGGEEREELAETTAVRGRSKMCK